MLVQISVVVVAIVIAISGQPLDPSEGDSRSIIQVFGLRKKVGDLIHNIWNDWNSLLWCGSLTCPSFPDDSGNPGDGNTKPEEETTERAPMNSPSAKPTPKFTTTTTAATSPHKLTKSS